MYTQRLRIVIFTTHLWALVYSSQKEAKWSRRLCYYGRHGHTEKLKEGKNSAEIKTTIHRRFSLFSLLFKFMNKFYLCRKEKNMDMNVLPIVEGTKKRAARFTMYVAVGRHNRRWTPKYRNYIRQGEREREPQLLDFIYIYVCIGRCIPSTRVVVWLLLLFYSFLVYRFKDPVCALSLRLLNFPPFILSHFSSLLLFIKEL